MCGIAGYVSIDRETERIPLLREMANGLRHRGPDDEGFFVEPGVGLAMRRLSIVDLECGRQPIANEDGTVHVICNGEIYNYVELRAGLEARGHRLTTQGDVEALVHLYEEHGVEMLQHLRGMFAFALWDSRKKTLFLARDRLGKKPLHYALIDGVLYFCSELAPLLDQKLAAWEIDPEALAAYLQFGFISAPRTIVRQIQKLPPAHYLLWNAGQMEVRRYWRFTQEPKLDCSYEDAREEVRATLDESLRLRLRSDVPPGLLLSGGLDSNALLARLVRGLGQKVQTFTIGFAEKAFDESAIARASAKHFGVEHHVLTGSTDLLQLMPEVVRHYGEPSADKSALPTMLVCELTRQHVKVALSGDGGDEAFAGYSKHRLQSWQVAVSRWFPRELRARWTLHSMTGGSKAAGKLRRQLLAETPSLFSGEFFSGEFFPRITTPLLRAQSEQFLGEIVADFWNGERDALDRILFWDNTEPLPNSLLTKLDIASMARGLEVRSPFLDQEMVELCARLPNEWKGNHREGKLILRDLVAADLPTEVLRAPKRGFSVPLGQWWRGEARQQIHDGILPLHPALRPFLREETAAHLLEEHQAGRANHAQRLWNLWVLNEWARMFLR
ncbi:MAG TPA: asparagine synthase (glutamine-hydrolyzing) [Chthoniobacterales bacterium]|nr:asparagine synthase (glutamine-hydrolyzing) [Chthoniobacterales bacterium]